MLLVLAYTRATLLFSVSLQDCTFGTSNMSLSLVQIPIPQCPPTMQRSMKRYCYSHQQRPKIKWVLPFVGLFASLQASSLYVLPGTPHFLVPGTSLDTTCQRTLLQTAVHNAVCLVPNHISQHVPVDQVTAQGLITAPYYCVADTDSS